MKKRKDSGKEYIRIFGIGFWGIRMINIIEECVWYWMFVFFDRVLVWVIVWIIWGSCFVFYFYDNCI